MLRNLDPVAAPTDPLAPSNSAAPLQGTHAVVPRQRSWSTTFAAAIRWLHIYISLLGFTALVLFGLTGITLNHPTWFGADSQHIAEASGKMETQWLRTAPVPSVSQSPSQPRDEGAANTAPEATEEAPEPSIVGKLEVVEFLRATHGIRGAVSEFRTDDYECLVLFKGPAYAADAVIDRESGKYQVTVTTLGTVAWINDLHKGRDTGFAWSIVIDVVSIVTVLASVTGLILIFYIKRVS